MSNHVRLIAIPKYKESLAKAIGETHRLCTRKINFEQKVKGHLFQERFYSTPLDEEHLLNAPCPIVLTLSGIIKSPVNPLHR
jgi:putative transposase